MASLGTNAFGGDSLFVSPDHLMIDNDLNDFRTGDHAAASYGPNHSQQQRSVSFAEHQSHQRPSLSLSASEWSLPTQAHFRAKLPPTPVSPFRTLPQLSEDHKNAFPCLGGPEDCWNTSLCPKHRQYPSAAAQSQHPGFSQPKVDTRPPPNPRRRSAPADDNKPDSDYKPPPKIKRNSTVSEEHDLESRPSYHHRRDSRNCALSHNARGRVPHNLVERRYRDNLNNQIEALRLTLPSLKEAQPCNGITDFEDTSSPRMPSKAIIISTAASYIKDMENERTRLLDANKALQEQVCSLQKLIRCDELNVVQYLNAMRLNAAQLPTPS